MKQTYMKPQTLIVAVGIQTTLMAGTQVLPKSDESVNSSYENLSRQRRRSVWDDEEMEDEE